MSSTFRTQPRDTEVEPKARPAFLSSLSKDLKCFREDLHAQMHPDLWVAERDRPDLSPDIREPLEIVDALLDQLKQCDLFICILAGRRHGEDQTGTPINVGQVSALVSYFEIEVFQAALHHIPAVFLARSDFDPGPELRDFLELLRGCSIEVRWLTGLSNSEITHEIRLAINDRANLCAAVAEKRSFAATELAERLLQKRALLADVCSGGNDMLFLQGKKFATPRSAGNLDRVQSLLDSASRESRHDHRLARLYLGLRELMSMPFQESKDPVLLSLWNDFFDMWWASAAWYGLHNHLSLGVIGALWSQYEVRRRLLAKESANDHLNTTLPFGALASAYFSLSKLMENKRLRQETTASGIFLANNAIALYGDADPGIYAVRGSLFFVRHQPIRAMADFVHLYYLARRQPENLRLNAEAHSYFGKGLTILGMSVLARGHLEDAAQLWREEINKSGQGKEFLVKTLKNLIELHLRAKKYDKATESAHESLILAEELKANDQKSQIETMLKAAGVALPIDSQKS